MHYLLQVKWAVVCLAFVCFAQVASYGQSFTAEKLAASSGASRYRAGVRNAPGARQLNAQQRQQVLQSLREKTGWSALDFDEAGFLVCPDPQVFHGGSASARRLLGAALTGHEVYELESHHASQSVSFASLTAGTVYSSDRLGSRINSYLVQLDFADFQLLEGERAALKAFDIGFAVLHELTHGVWRLRDAVSLEAEPGECEAFINQVRRELHLPERQHYRARVSSLRFSIAFGTRLLAELHFTTTSKIQGRSKKRHYQLRWDAEAVGQVKGLDRSVKASLTTASR